MVFTHSIQIRVSKEQHEHIARMTLTVEVADIDKISQVLTKISQLPNVTDARRRMQ